MTDEILVSYPAQRVEGVRDRFPTLIRVDGKPRLVHFEYVEIRDCFGRPVSFGVPVAVFPMPRRYRDKKRRVVDKGHVVLCCLSVDGVILEFDMDGTVSELVRFSRFNHLRFYGSMALAIEAVESKLASYAPGDFLWDYIEVLEDR